MLTALNYQNLAVFFAFHCMFLFSYPELINACPDDRCSAYTIRTAGAVVECQRPFISACTLGQDQSHITARIKINCFVCHKQMPNHKQLTVCIAGNSIATIV